MDESHTGSTSNPRISNHVQEETYANSKGNAGFLISWSCTWSNSFGDSGSWTKTPSSPLYHVMGDIWSWADSNSSGYNKSRTESEHQIDTDYYG